MNTSLRSFAFLGSVLTLLLMDFQQGVAQSGEFRQTSVQRGNSLTSASTNTGDDSMEECTIGVATGMATKDGRPMVWKTRDSSPRKNALYYNTTSRYRFIAVIDGGSPSSSWMSVNEKGFAIVNSTSEDLKTTATGPGNGSLMTLAVGTCATIAEFQHLLDSTNVTQRQTRANFAVIDSTGAAAIFETGGTSYSKYDAASTPSGYVLRTNFAFSGGGGKGLRRFQRTTALFQTYTAGDSLLPRTLLRYQMRDFSDASGIPYAIPFSGSVSPGVPAGYIQTDSTICRYISVSAAVIHGVKNGEPAASSTMWTILGQPATGIAVPYWPIGQPPDIARDLPTALLNDEATALFTNLWNSASYPSYVRTAGLRTTTGGGIWSILFPTEDQLFAAADTLLTSWRSGKLSPAAVLSAEASYAALALSSLQSAKMMLTSIAQESETAVPSTFQLSQNYPNPFNPSTVIQFQLTEAGPVELKVFDMLGRLVATLVDKEMSVGTHLASWDAARFASGVYIYSLKTKLFSATKRMVLIR